MRVLPPTRNWCFVPVVFVLFGAFLVLVFALVKLEFFGGERSLLHWSFFGRFAWRGGGDKISKY